MAWFELASHLGMSLQRCQSETTSREFNQWRWYLDKQFEKQEPIHWYLAQIALEQRRTAHPKSRLRLKDFLLNFKRSSTPKAPKTQQEIDQQTARSKGFWSALLFTKPKG